MLQIFMVPRWCILITQHDIAPPAGKDIATLLHECSTLRQTKKCEQNTACIGMKCIRSSWSPEDEPWGFYNPLTWSSTTNKSKFTLNMSTSTSCIDKKTLQTFRVPRWWNLMTNFSSAVTSRLNFLIHNDGLIDGLSWKGSDIRGPHRMDRDKFADPVTFHFAPSNSDVIINFSMQSFYRCEHVSMLTSAFRLF